MLYNSECDNEHPRSVEDILRQIQKEEMDKKNYTSISSVSIETDTVYKCLLFVFCFVIFFALKLNERQKEVHTKCIICGWTKPVILL